MKTIQRAGIAALVVALVAMFGGIDKTATPAAHAGQSCNDSTVNGVYTALWTVNAIGLQTKPKRSDAFIPSSVDAIAFFDGSGHWSSTGFTSFGGTYGKFSIHGPYNVRPDCTGHFQEPGLAFDFIILQHGDVLDAIDATGSAGVFQMVRDHE